MTCSHFGVNPVHTDQDSKAKLICGSEQTRKHPLPPTPDNSVLKPLGGQSQAAREQGTGAEGMTPDRGGRAQAGMRAAPAEGGGSMVTTHTRGDWPAK